MKYEDIYSRFLSRSDPQDLLELPKDMFYNVMSEYLHNAVAQPMIRKLFLSVSFDDEIMELTYSLSDSIDDDSDEQFVMDVLAQELVIQWMRHRIDTYQSMITMVGGKEEKMLKNDLSINISRADSLEHQLQRTIRNHGYYNGSYSTG